VTERCETNSSFPFSFELLFLSFSDSKPLFDLAFSVEEASAYAFTFSWHFGHTKGKLWMSSISARFMLKQAAWNHSSQVSHPIISIVSG
jgi:hypothetical protein